MMKTPGWMISQMPPVIIVRVRRIRRSAASSQCASWHHHSGFGAAIDVALDFRADAQPWLGFIEEAHDLECRDVAASKLRQPVETIVLVANVYCQLEPLRLPPCLQYGIVKPLDFLPSSTVDTVDTVDGDNRAHGTKDFPDE
jgi:hypothetical protein